MSQVQFLARQNEELRFEVEQLKQVLAASKRGFDALCSAKKDPNWAGVVQSLRSETQILRKQNQRLKGEASRAQSEILLLRQITSHYEENLRNQTEEMSARYIRLSKKYSELKRELEQVRACKLPKNYLIMEFVATPEEQAVLYQQHLSALQQELQRCQAQLLREKERNLELVRLLICYEEGERIPTSAPSQPYIRTNVDELVESQADMQQQEKDQKQPEQQLQADESQFLRRLPKLDMSKTKDIHNLIIEKMVVDQRPGSTGETGLLKSEIKKKAHLIMTLYFKVSTLEQENSKLHCILKECQQRNHRLVAAHGRTASREEGQPGRWALMQAAKDVLVAEGNLAGMENGLLRFKRQQGAKDF